MYHPLQRASQAECGVHHWQHPSPGQTPCIHTHTNTHTHTSLVRTPTSQLHAGIHNRGQIWVKHRFWAVIKIVLVRGESIINWTQCTWTPVICTIAVSYLGPTQNFTKVNIYNIGLPNTSSVWLLLQPDHQWSLKNITKTTTTGGNPHS